MTRIFLSAALVFFLFGAALQANEIEDAGRDELANAFKGARPIWPMRGFANLPRIWADQVEGTDPASVKERERLRRLAPQSEGFRAELAKRYGLYYEPSLPNDGLPYGLTKTNAGFNTSLTALNGTPGEGEPGFTFNCRGCHAGAFFGRPGGATVFVDGLSNVFIDIERFQRDVLAAADLGWGNLFMKNPPRNSMVNSADYFGRLLTYIRRPYPQFDLITGYQLFYGRFRLPRHRHLENDIQAFLKTQNWVNVGTKLNGTENQGLYVDGGFKDNPSSIMYGVIFSLDPTGQDFLAADQGFRERGLPYLQQLKAPPYPLLASVDKKAAERGFEVYNHTCTGCHGKYQRTATGYELVSYPGRIVNLARIKTDPLRANDQGFGDVYQGDLWVRSGGIVQTGGYQAPPLHGIWARAPYLHNGSVPNLRQLMKPETRVARYAIQPSPREASNYDEKNMGWKITPLANADEVAKLKKADPYVRIYDPDAYPHGLTNTGHDFGAKLTDPQVDDLIAFLKNL